MAQTPEQSDYTSIQERIKLKNSTLKRFGTSDNCIPFALNDYLELVETTGRAFTGKQKGQIPAELPEILQRLDLNYTTWLKQIKYFDKWYFKAIGAIEKMQKYSQSISQKWIKGIPKSIKQVLN